MSAETESLQSRLEAARKRRAEIEAEARVTDEQAHLAAEVERAERAVIEAEALERAKREIGPLGKIGFVDTRIGRVILKRPHHVLYRKFQETKPEDFDMDELEKIVRSCLVYPDASAFERLIQELPHALVVCGELMAKLAGAGAKEVAGK